MEYAAWYDCSSLFRKWGHFILALCWMIGLLFGLRLFFDAGSFSVSLMPMAVSCRVSIVGLLTSVFLPFLFAVIAVYLSQPVALCAVCFLKAVSLAFISSAVSHVFGSAGWLIWLLFLFHDIAASVLLYLYAHRHVSCSKPFCITETVIFCVINTLAAAFAYHIVSPFLSGLIIIWKG